MIKKILFGIFIFCGVTGFCQDKEQLLKASIKLNSSFNKKSAESGYALVGLKSRFGTKLENQEEVKEEITHLEYIGDTMMVEVAIPGAKREDFIVHANRNEISICLLKKTSTPSSKNYALHEFNYGCFERHITLPENVDPEFIHAEYASGMLRLFIPKTRQPLKNKDTRIVVY